MPRCFVRWKNATSLHGMPIQRNKGVERMVGDRADDPGTDRRDRSYVASSSVLAVSPRVGGAGYRLAKQVPSIGHVI